MGESWLKDMAICGVRVCTTSSNGEGDGDGKDGAGDGAGDGTDDGTGESAAAWPSCAVCTENATARDALQHTCAPTSLK